MYLSLLKGNINRQELAWKNKQTFCPRDISKFVAVGTTEATQRKSRRLKLLFLFNYKLKYNCTSL